MRPRPTSSRLIAVWPLACVLIAATLPAVAESGRPARRGPAILLEATPDHTVFRLEVPDAVRVEPVADRRFGQVRIPGFGFTDEVGAPRLPLCSEIESALGAATDPDHRVNRSRSLGGSLR